MLLPEKEQMDDFELGRNFLRKNSFFVKFFSDSGKLSHLLDATRVLNTGDFSIQRCKPYKGTYIEYDSREYIVRDSKTHKRLSTDYSQEDIFESEYDKPSTRTDKERMALYFEEMSPTYVWQYITQFIFQQTKGHSSIRLLGETGFDTKAHFDEDDYVGNDTIAEDTRAAEIFNTNEMFEELCYHLRYLYEAGKRSSIRTHLIAACAWLARCRSTPDPKKYLGNSEIFQRHIPYFRHTSDKGYFWCIPSHGNIDAEKQAPGVAALIEWVNGIDNPDSCITPKIKDNMEQVLYLCSKLNIDLKAPVPNKDGSIMKPAEYFLKFSDENLPSALSKTFISNSDYVEDMFYTLKNMHKVPVTRSTASKSPTAIMHDSVNRFFDVEPVLYITETLATKNPMHIGALCMDLDGVVEKLKAIRAKEGQQVVSLPITEDNIRFSNGLVSCEISPAVDIPVTFMGTALNYPGNATSLVLLNNGLIVPTNIDYNKPFYVLSLNSVFVKAICPAIDLKPQWKNVMPTGIYNY